MAYLLCHPDMVYLSILSEQQNKQGYKDMIMFNCDYNEGAHPKIIELLEKTNFEQTPGYGEDHYCEKARNLIRKACGRNDIDVHFLTGGTQANLTVISAALRTHQGVLSAHTGHINIHEAGAIEATGHKVLPLPGGSEGKISATAVEGAVRLHWEDETHEHMVQPKMVYISHPTENGALYSKDELLALREVCDRKGLLLFLDGARLGYGLASADTDVTLKDLCRCCDVFYIGGTKVGALFGEAVVITNESLKEDFCYIIKQKGGMLAKGRFLGLQFLALFEDDTYTKIAREADEQAARIARACTGAGFPLLAASPTNQQFPILPDDLIARLSEKYVFSHWERIDSSHCAIRICTSWATRSEDVDELIADIQALKA